MDWKDFYACELDDPRGRAIAEAALHRHERGDRRVEAALRIGGIASFPHVTLQDSANPIARVVGTLYEMNVKRVVALGVLHGSSLPAHHRRRHAAMAHDTPEGAEAFRWLGGAVTARGTVDTPFGPISEGPSADSSSLLREAPDLLRQEFFLDLFLALLAAGGRDRGTRPPAVTCIYISATRDPSGGFESAEVIGHAIGGLVDEETACVATGDVAHIGHGYSTPAEAAALPPSVDALTTSIVPQLAAMHETALARHDFAAAWAIGTRLMSDQRQMLPVIATLLGMCAVCELLEFRLSDYSSINRRPEPCFVASALSAFTP